MRKNSKKIELRPITIKKKLHDKPFIILFNRTWNTKVICCVSLEESVPRWLRGKGKGWITSEYSMLPTATHTRTDRESVKGKTLRKNFEEIQRLIGRFYKKCL